MPLGRFIAVCFLLAALAIAALATPPGPIEAVVPPAQKKIEFTEYNLANGLHVILHENHSAPVIATYVLYHVGSKDERADRTGFAHFFEHLMFEGSENIPRGRIDKLVSGAGGNLNASTSFDFTDYHFNLPSNQLPLALWIESERMLHAKVDETGVETQRNVVKEERRRGVENRPYGTLFENLAAMVFEGSPYQWTPIGSAQYIDEAKIEEFRDFYRKYYVPNNATLVVAGDFEVENAKRLIEEYFAEIPRGPEIPRPEVNLTPQNGPKLKVVEKENTPLPAALYAWRGPIETSPDAYAIDLLTNILARGRSSRLYQRLVNQEQAAVEIQAFPSLLEKAGMVGVFAMGNRGVALSRLDQLINEEIAKVREHGVTPEEFEKARNQKEMELASAFGSMQSRARSLARYHVFYGDTNLINTELEKYLAVTREDLQRVANEYLKPDAVNILHYPVPEKAAGQEGKGS